MIIVVVVVAGVIVAFAAGVVVGIQLQNNTLSFEFNIIESILKIKYSLKIFFKNTFETNTP